MTRPVRLGFLGLGWIGRHRMAAMLDSGQVCAAGFLEPSDEQAAAAHGLAPGSQRVDTMDTLLDLQLDGLVIATPSALHAEQARRALDRGVAVFCQKPLGRDEAETAGVVAAAERADRLLGVDLSYRHIAGMRQVRDLVATGALGRIYAVDLVFHNAYGPDKPWFYDPHQSGGGCVVDLGVHLVDLALWTLGFPDVDAVSAQLFAGGHRLADRPGQVEDHAVATLELATGTGVQLACSWRLHAGRDAIISAAFHGTGGGAALRNVDGSFYDFTAERYAGTATHIMAAPPDAWGGRAAVEWATRLAAGAGFDAAAWRYVEVARVLDRIYGRARSPATRAITPAQPPGAAWR